MITNKTYEMMITLHRWCNGLRGQLESGRSLVRAPIRSNQRL